MRRALQLAALGYGRVSPNPMVGAVVVAGGRIIGEGWHRAWGGPHAEVNAIASVKEEDRRLLPEATIYVTLEPCSHYGKTPPCAKLIIESGLKRVVSGCRDPFPAVAGRGLQMLRDAGIEVTEGILEQECRGLNRRFMTAHTFGRPWIQLKWAQTADGFMAHADAGQRLIISSPVTMTLMHRERAGFDAILAGTHTVIADNPRLDCRLWPGRTPLKAGFASRRIPADAHILEGAGMMKTPEEPLIEYVRRLYSEGKVTSLMVEGGAATLRSFIEAGLYDEIRVETSPEVIGKGLEAPALPKDTDEVCALKVGANSIRLYHRKAGI